MNVTITPAELRVLLSSKETRDLTCGLLDADKISLEGTEGQLSELREAVSDALMRLGFDEGYNVTADGAVLEGLIDKLFTG